MDKTNSYLLTLGYTTKDIHGLKALDKIRRISNHFKMGKVPYIPKSEAKKFLAEFIELETKSKDTFRLLAEIYIRKYLYKLGPNYNQMDEHSLTITCLPADKFYASPEWRSLRYKVLELYGNKCAACGRSPKNGVVIHVDHILPRSIYPEHALNISNLQVLCDQCNLGKSNLYEKDWRF